MKVLVNVRYPRWIRRLGGFLLLLLLISIASGGFIFYKLAASRPTLDGTFHLAGLGAPVKVASDSLMVPAIEAHSRVDAFRVLGFISARDRLFQMDLMRRKSAGRLAEVLGAGALALDRQQRYLGFERAARRILAQLPKDQMRLLRAYAEGVNSFIEQADTLPFEFLLLGYRPEPWRMEDSFLVALGMFQTLNWHGHSERMLTVMRETLPAEVVAFLTPATDQYEQTLLGGAVSHNPAQPIPSEALAALLHANNTKDLTGLVQEAVSIGSNNWAVNRSKTSDGRAIMANDMHLGLAVPNIWYRAVLRYGGMELNGITLSGVPLLVAGSNGHVAWGYTNVSADVIDLVRLELNPHNPDEYRTPDGWRSFAKVRETIRVKGREPEVVEVKYTLWGPLSPKDLLGQPVAVRWTALDPEAVNLKLLEMDRAFTLESAIRIMNRAGIPANNVILADDRGRIAWTYAGKYPLRSGFDGSISLSWADGRIGWQGYIAPDELPRVIDPPAGFLATANDRTLGAEYPYVIGHNYEHSYRAYRIGEMLEQKDQLTEQNLFAMQLDTVTHFYEFYRTLALSVLDEEAIKDKPLLMEARDSLKSWNGRADIDSQGIGLLRLFHLNLAEAVFSPFLAGCKEKDGDFHYSWHKMDAPLRRLLQEKIPQTLPDQQHFADWHEFIRAVLEESAQELKQSYFLKSLKALDWGRINQISIAHPFSRVVPALASYLDMPKQALAGCKFCVRAIGQTYGASERLVVSPGHPQDGILHMPGGQSGHPLSPHYRDQHPYWVQGLPLEFAPGPTEHTLNFEPRS